jgi:ubiquinone/menaquinone biosynthesis C-methylase UbiE
MLGPLLLVAIVTAAWFVSRYAGRGKPYPVWMSGLLDNPVTYRLSGTTTLAERASVTKGMRVLDAGCGPGRLTIPLARRVGTAGEVVALDVQEGMLERVRRRAAEHGLTNIRTLRSGLGAVTGTQELRVAGFDRVLLVTVLGEVPDPERAMRELYSVLKPGGLLSVTELIIDPDYQPRNRVRALGQDVGFEIERSYGTALAFTQNFRKPGK